MTVVQYSAESLQYFAVPKYSRLGGFIYFFCFFDKYVGSMLNGGANKELANFQKQTCNINLTEIFLFEWA